MLVLYVGWLMGTFRVLCIGQLYFTLEEGRLMYYLRSLAQT